jgi:GNAT superfamily N-acetyltransferase
MTLTFVRADLIQHRDTLLRFKIDYGNWVGEGVLEHFGLVLEDFLGAPMPDSVPQTSRGLGVGAGTLDRLMLDARTFGYKAGVLETGPFMRSAHRLYEAAGFADIAPYLNAEVPQKLRHDWRFMRRELD